MKAISAKNKIIITVSVWLLACLIMIFFGFDALSKTNRQTIFEIQESKKELASLESEKNSYLQAQKDLEKIQDERAQPQDFFSQDTSLVEELRILESLRETLGVKLTVGGVSGTASSAQKAKTQSEMVSIPYTISASGPFENIVRLTQVLENLPFVTTISSMALSVADEGNVNLSVGANFYIRK